MNTEKKYTDEEYVEMAIKANNEQKILVVENGELKLVDIHNEILVPNSITKRQAMLQLNKVGLYEPLINMINETSNIELKIEFEYTTVFERESQFIIAVAQSFNLSDEQVDELFIEASKL